METPDAGRITRRALLRLGLAAPVVPGLIAAPTIHIAAQPRPVPPVVEHVRLDERRLKRSDIEEHARATGGRRPRHAMASDTIKTEPFHLTGLTWTDAPPDTTVLVRTRPRGSGRWSDWIELHDDRHGPDPDTEEGRQARRGTDAIVVGDSDAIQIRIESADANVPDDLRVELIHPGASPADATVGTRVPGRAEASVSSPQILTRAEWGADESLRSQSPPSYGDVRGAFVHHTASSNGYSSSQVPAIIRSIYAYHVQGRGWRDIGYNFLVDRFGRIWEGRYGGITRAVVGAHVSRYNSYAFGASVLGTYTSTDLVPAALKALQQLIVWKLSVHDVDPSGTVAYPGLRTLPKVAGHRDAGSTECPGARLYASQGSTTAGIDAAVWRMDVDKLYFFVGDEYVRITNVGRLDSNYPRKIAGNWRGLPSSFQQGIDAALWRQDNGRLYFFKGDQYVRFAANSATVDHGYPKPIAGNWPGLPASFNRGIDAALWRQSNGRLYLFKGDQYVRFASRVSSGVDPGYPKPIAGNWPGLPRAYNGGIDAALMRPGNGRIYFFDGPTYVRYSSVPRGIDSGYPKWIDRNWMPFPQQPA